MEQQNLNNPQAANSDLGAVRRSYSFTEPKYFVDDEVWFKDNKGERK